MLAYLSRYTHCVAISNSRLIALDHKVVTFKWKDYRAKQRDRHKTMTLVADEFIRRFLIHVLPSRFHRIRHYGLFANKVRAMHLARAQQLLQQIPSALTADNADNEHAATAVYRCTSCGAPMFIIETFDPAHAARAPPTGPP